MIDKKIPDHYHYLGRLGKTYQLKGGLRLYSDSHDLDLSTLEHVFIEGIGKSDVRQIREVGSDLIIYLTHALTVEQAQKLVNKNLYVHKELLPEGLTSDLIGLRVFLEGQSFGHVVDLEEGLQDLLIVEADNKEYLIPLEAPYVRIEDDGVFLEDVPEGLLE